VADSPKENPGAAQVAAPVFGFSIQNDNMFVAVHIDVPFMSVVFAIPVPAVEAFAEDFATQMKELAAEAARDKNGLIVATDATMNVLKGKK
jgi:hypothetical protein